MNVKRLAINGLRCSLRWEYMCAGYVVLEGDRVCETLFGVCETQTVLKRGALLKVRAFTEHGPAQTTTWRLPCVRVRRSRDAKTHRFEVHARGKIVIGEAA